jgi:hypothetical protein
MMISLRTVTNAKLSSTFYQEVVELLERSPSALLREGSNDVVSSQFLGEKQGDRELQVEGLRA